MSAAGAAMGPGRACRRRGDGGGGCVRRGALDVDALAPPHGVDRVDDCVVLARSAVDPVGLAVARVQQVVAGFAAQPVQAGAADEAVVARAAEQQVVAAAAGQAVVAPPPLIVSAGGVHRSIDRLCRFL